MTIILRDSKTNSNTKSRSSFALFVFKQVIPADAFKVRFKCCIDQEDIRRWYILQLFIQEKIFADLGFQKMLTTCRIGKPTRQASKMLPNLMPAVAQK